MFLCHVRVYLFYSFFFQSVLLFMNVLPTSFLLTLPMTAFGILCFNYCHCHGYEQHLYDSVTILCNILIKMFSTQIREEEKKLFKSQISDHD